MENNWFFLVEVGGDVAFTEEGKYLQKANLKQTARPELQRKSQSSAKD